MLLQPLQPVPQETTIDHCHYVWCHFLGWIANWLVVDLPLWKIYESQMGWWLFPVYGKIWNSCSKAPTSYGGLRKNSPFQMPVDPHGPTGGDYDWSESPHQGWVENFAGEAWNDQDGPWDVHTLLFFHFFPFTFLFPVACGFNLIDINRYKSQSWISSSSVGWKRTGVKVETARRFWTYLDEV